MLHIPLSLVSLGFPPMDENLQDTIVVKKTVHKRNRRTEAWEPVLHARTL